MALVEAMSMGIPVLGSNISGVNFVLKDFKNLLFEASNSSQLAEKIMEIKNLSEHERNDLGNKLRQYCIEHFLYSSFIKKHEDLYVALVKK